MTSIVSTLRFESFDKQALVITIDGATAAMMKKNSNYTLDDLAEGIRQAIELAVVPIR